MNKDDLAREMEIERAKPMPSSVPTSRQYDTLMRQMGHYATGVGINWPLFQERAARLCVRFETDNLIVALERLFHELEEDGLALVAKRRRR
jgi:hypothetical protein